MRREDMKAAAKFTVICEICHKRQASRPVTAWTAQRWMSAHEDEHRKQAAQNAQDAP